MNKAQHASVSSQDLSLEANDFCARCLRHVSHRLPHLFTIAVKQDHSFNNRDVYIILKSYSELFPAPNPLHDHLYIARA
jgi:hypothetical protein